MDMSSIIVSKNDILKLVFVYFAAPRYVIMNLPNKTIEVYYEANRLENNLLRQLLRNY